MRVLVTRAVALLILVSSLSASGADDARRYLTAAQLLYQRLDYERALDQLRKAQQLSKGVSDDVVISLYQGIILYEMGRSEDALAAFSNALYLDPSAQLPIKVSPKTAAAFEKERTRVQRELATKRLGANPLVEVHQAQPEHPTRVSLRWVPLAAGAAVAGGGATCLYLSHQNYLQLASPGPPLSPGAAHQLASVGSSLQTAGDLALALGAAGVIVGTGMLLLGGADAPQVTVVPTASGATAVLRGSFP